VGQTGIADACVVAASTSPAGENASARIRAGVASARIVQSAVVQSWTPASVAEAACLPSGETVTK
jgi:hypothetical protein